MVNTWEGVGHFKIKEELRVNLLPKDSNDVATRRVSHSDEYRRKCVPRLRENEKMMRFCDQHLAPSRMLQPDSQSRNHVAVANYAYSLNPGQRFSHQGDKKISFNVEPAVVLESRGYAFDAVDLTLTQKKDGQKKPVFYKVEKKEVKPASPHDVYRFMQKKNIERLEILKIPCDLSDKTAYRRVE